MNKGRVVFAILTIIIGTGLILTLSAQAAPLTDYGIKPTSKDTIRTPAVSKDTLRTPTVKGINSNAVVRPNNAAILRSGLSNFGGKAIKAQNPAGRILDKPLAAPRASRPVGINNIGGLRSRSSLTGGASLGRNTTTAPKTRGITGSTMTIQRNTAAPKAGRSLPVMPRALQLR